MSAQVINRTQLLSPRDAIGIAWARTDELSTNEKIHENAERVKNRMNNIVEITDKGTNDKEKEYINKAFIAVESTYRNLITITNGRDNNYKEIDAIRKQQADDMQSLASVVPTLQSVIPRIAETTIGGIAVGTLFGKPFTQIFPSLGDSAFPILVALGAAVFFIISELFINPWFTKRKLLTIIQLDYDKDLYYQQYINRLKKALVSLYNQVEKLHEEIFNIKYSKKSNAKDEVDDLLSGIDTTMCNNTPTCLKNKKISPDNWSICETGETKTECEEYKKIK